MGTMATPNSPSASRKFFKNPLNYHYRLNVCAPPQHLHGEALLPNVTVLGAGALGRSSGLDVIMIVGPWSDEILALNAKRHQRASALTFSLSLSAT